MDFAELSALAGAHVEARAIQVGLKLGLFEALAAAALNESALAEAIRCDRRATGLLANALTAMGLLEKREGLFSLTEAARRYLVESSDEFLGGMILFDEALFPTWARLEEAVRSGAPARMPDMFQERPEETERFVRAMDSLTRARGDARYLAQTLDLGGVGKMIDLGGGPGTYLLEFVKRWPAMRGTICDLPATLEVTRRILAERNPQELERIELVTVDYLSDELPGPCDAIFLSNIIHSEDAATNQMLARKCFRALGPGGRIFVKDHIMNHELTEPRAGAVFSLYLLLTTRGRDYSLDEVAPWLAAAGFEDIRHHPLPTPPFTSSLVIARKP